ncbi:hypothetical protein E2C01_081485 [Portunus trituberculatus]|uniref:Uncharacterized protein n=1 Tax=Portunus trituberculatus TaxID=210409 RepID=A0A5B7IWS8_PORTR|nr:hypothetical protein [Portunus trituberculatus]
MPGNVTLSLETLATNITLELPQASVSESMFVEITNGKEFLAALFTFIIFNITVSQEFKSQEGGNTEAGRESQSVPEKGMSDRVLVNSCIREVDRLEVRKGRKCSVGGM